MWKATSLIAIALTCGACSSDDVKDLVTPPDAVGNHSSNQAIPTDQVSSSSSLDEFQGMSSEASQSSMLAQSSDGLSLPSSEASSSAAQSSEAFSSEASHSSSIATVSSESFSSSSAGASSSESFSSDAVTSPPEAQLLFDDQCASCHNLETNLPFQIGANLSFTELHETIGNTMPFNNSNHCTGECAMQLAYFIESVRLSN